MDSSYRKTYIHAEIWPSNCILRAVAVASFFGFGVFLGVLALPHRSDARTDFDRSWVIRRVLV